MTKIKILRSTLRTIVALLILVMAISLIRLGFSWTSWCPDNDFGILLLLLIYGMGVILMAYGIYQIAPIFWMRVMPDILMDTMDLPTDWYEYKTKMKKLCDRYMW